MKFVLFYHSILSDWNHGNAHFLRGIASELVERGHQVVVYEPAEATFSTAPCGFMIWILSFVREERLQPTEKRTRD